MSEDMTSRPPPTNQTPVSIRMAMPPGTYTHAPITNDPSRRGSAGGQMIQPRGGPLIGNYQYAQGTCMA